MTDDEIKQRAGEIVDAVWKELPMDIRQVDIDRRIAERALREGMATYEQDAKRYRWLRWQGATFYEDVDQPDPNADQHAIRHHVAEWAMDAAIDAAMIKEEGK